MKKTLVGFLLLVMMSPLVLSQDDNSIPPLPPKRGKAGKVGAFGGFTPGWLFMDVKPINTYLRNAKGAPLNENGVFMYGGAGSAFIMFIPNLRVGGLGMSGSIKSTSLEILPGGQRFRRDAELNVGFGGVTLEYVVPLAERLDLSVGTMLGGGGIDLTLRQSNGADNTWGEEWGNFGGTGQVGNSTRTLSGSYFIWIPAVNVEYAVLGWLGVRLGAAYVGMSVPSWQVDGKYELLGVPNNVSGKGLMINAGVFVGTY